MKNYAIRPGRETISPAPTNAPAGSGQPARLRTGAGERSAGSGIHVRFNETANWFTPSGVWKKRRNLKKKGLPDMKGRRFITVSVDPSQFDYCPLTAYLAGKEHMRRFLEAGRVAGLWTRGCWWAWKLEFQRNGWPHWHLIIDRVAKFSESEMAKINDIWAMGRTNCRRISKSRFGYQFKYAFKGVFQETDDGEQVSICVPQWFLDYYQPSIEGKKPSSFARCRFWQTSKGFYTGPVEQTPEPTEPSSSFLVRPVSQVLEDRNLTVVVFARNAQGKYIKSASLQLGVVVSQFIRVHLWGAEHGQGCTLSARSFVMDRHGINQVINQNQKWKLQPLLTQNRLSLHQAKQLRQNRINLETF